MHQTFVIVLVHICFPTGPRAHFLLFPGPEAESIQAKAGPDLFSETGVVALLAYTWARGPPPGKLQLNCTSQSPTKAMRTLCLGPWGDIGSFTNLAASWQGENAGCSLQQHLSDSQRLWKGRHCLEGVITN